MANPSRHRPISGPGGAQGVAGIRWSSWAKFTASRHGHGVLDGRQRWTLPGAISARCSARAAARAGCVPARARAPDAQAVRIGRMKSDRRAADRLGSGTNISATTCCWSTRWGFLGGLRARSGACNRSAARQPRGVARRTGRWRTISAWRAVQVACAWFRRATACGSPTHQPAGGVGGDFFVCCRSGGRRASSSACHGPRVRSALITAMVRTMIELRPHAADPGRMLTELNTLGRLLRRTGA